MSSVMTRPAAAPALHRAETEPRRDLSFERGHSRSLFRC